MVGYNPQELCAFGARSWYDVNQISSLFDIPADCTVVWKGILLGDGRARRATPSMTLGEVAGPGLTLNPGGLRGYG